MTPDQFVTVVGAISALVIAVGGLLFQVRAWREQIDGRMSDLLKVTRQSAHAEGKLEAIDAAAAPPPDA